MGNSVRKSRLAGKTKNLVKAAAEARVQRLVAGEVWWSSGIFQTIYGRINLSALQLEWKIVLLWKFSLCRRNIFAKKFHRKSLFREFFLSSKFENFALLIMNTIMLWKFEANKIMHSNELTQSTCRDVHFSFCLQILWSDAIWRANNFEFSSSAKTFYVRKQKAKLKLNLSEMPGEQP